MANPLIWIALLVLMNVFWGGSYSAMKYGLTSLDPLALVFYRLVIGFAILGSWIAMRRYDIRIGWRDGVRVIFAGLAIAASSWCTVKGVEMSYATDASLLYVFEPVWGIILACIFLKERLLATTVTGLFLSVAGFVRLSGFGVSGTSFLERGVGIGNLLIVVGLMAEGLFSILLKPSSRRHPAVVLFAGVLLVASAALALPLYFRQGFAIELDSAGIFSIAYLAAICTALGYTVWVAVLRHVPLSVMEFTIFVQPIAGTIIAALFLGEAIDARVISGGALCLIGMAIAVAGHVHWSRSRRSAVSTAGLVMPADAL